VRPCAKYFIPCATDLSTVPVMLWSVHWNVQTELSSTRRVESRLESSIDDGLAAIVGPYSSRHSVIDGDYRKLDAHRAPPTIPYAIEYGLVVDKFTKNNLCRGNKRSYCVRHVDTRCLRAPTGRHSAKLSP